MTKKYFITLALCINMCHAGTYPSNLADYVVSSDPKRFEQDVKYISVVASCCASISEIYKAIENNENNFITANFEKYKKSIFEIIPQAVAKCVLKIDEFSNVSNDIVKFAGVNEENFTQAEVNAVVLYNWIYQLMKDKNDTTKITIDKLAEHIGNKTKINQAKLQKAISDIKEYDKVLRLTQYFCKLHKCITWNKNYPKILKIKHYQNGYIDNKKYSRVEFDTRMITSKPNAIEYSLGRIRILLFSGETPIASRKKLLNSICSKVRYRAFYKLNNEMEYKGVGFNYCHAYKKAPLDSIYGRLREKYAELYYLNPLCIQDDSKGYCNDNMQDMYTIDFECVDATRVGSNKKEEKDVIISKLAINNAHVFFKNKKNATFKITIPGHRTIKSTRYNFKFAPKQGSDVSSIFDFSLGKSNNSNNKIMLKLGSLATGKLLLPSNCGQLFADKDLSSIDITYTDATDVIYANSMFEDNSGLEKIKGLNVFNESKLQSISNMFRWTGLTAIDIDWSKLSQDTIKSNGLSVDCAFSYMPQLKEVKLLIPNIQIINMESMFCNDTSLEKVKIDNNLKQVQNISGMFYGCKKLQDIDITFSGLNADKLYNFSKAKYQVDGAFAYCAALKELPHFKLFLDEKNKKKYKIYKAFDAIKLMFAGCKNLGEDFKKKYETLINGDETNTYNNINWDEKFE